MENNKIFDILVEPIITEKSNELIEKQNKYTFRVAKWANKIQIKEAVETIFKVKVKSVHTINVLPKKRTVGKYSGYRSGYKKAICQLAVGDKIDKFNV